MTKADWKLVFHRKLVGVYLGQFAVNSTLWFFLTWFPNYLTQEKGITALKAGFMTTVPFLAAFFGVLLSGWLADKLVKKASRWAWRAKRRLFAVCSSPRALWALTTLTIRCGLWH